MKNQQVILKPPLFFQQQRRIYRVAYIYLQFASSWGTSPIMSSTAFDLNS